MCSTLTAGNLAVIISATRWATTAVRGSCGWHTGASSAYGPIRVLAIASPLGSGPEEREGGIGTRQQHSSAAGRFPYPGRAPSIYDSSGCALDPLRVVKNLAFVRR